MTDIINNFPDGTVQIIFEIQYGDVVFKDSLFLSSDQYSSMTENDIDLIKQDRYNNWITSITPE